VFEFEQIDKARRILKLEECATLEEIKKAYKELAKKYHPDTCKASNKAKCEEKFKEINWAYQLLLKYCQNYKYSFKKEDVEKQKISPQYYQHLKRFYDGWWADLEI